VNSPEISERGDEPEAPLRDHYFDFRDLPVDQNLPKQINRQMAASSFRFLSTTNSTNANRACTFQFAKPELCVAGVLKRNCR